MWRGDSKNPDSPGGSSLLLDDLRSFSLREKPLPAPTVRGQLSIGAARAYHNARKRLRSFRWLPDAGWRTTVRAGAGLAVVILIINVIFLIWAYTKPVDPDTGSRTLWSGACASTQTTFTFSHMAINVLSTLLLGTSNAAMQCLSAPTREAVDRAHAKGTWLDIGTSGFRNWSSMDRWRKWCWILLGLSTVPLHLLYNSAIFATTSANEYYAFAVTPDFLKGEVLTLPNEKENQSTDPAPSPSLLSNLFALAHSNSLQVLDNSDCISTYNAQLVNTFSNVILVTKNNSESSIIQFYHHNPTPEVESQGGGIPIADWICGGFDDPNSKCNISNTLAHSSQWNFSIASVGDVHIDHCLLQETTPQCTVQLIPQIMLIVIVCNVVKVVCFIAAAYSPGFHPLITLGDALASFLDRPDPHTQDLGPLSAADIRAAQERIQIRKLISRHKEDTEMAKVQTAQALKLGPWTSQRRRWFSGASGLRWGLTYAMILTLWVLGWIVFAIASLLGDNMPDLASQWALGIGNVSPELLLEITAPISPLGNILIANAPQIVLSLIYLSYNGLFTCILLSHEFTKYANTRTSLRVTLPTGYQRGSYFLSLPYKFAVPLLALSGFLHWALSQSLFLAEIKAFKPDGTADSERSVSCLGYSTLALLVTLLLGAVMLITPVFLGWRRYSSGIPLLENNSLAMSAACHPEDSSNPSGLLKYGVLAVDRVGLRTSPVAPLVSGERYTTREELDVRPWEVTSTWKAFSLLQKILIPTLALFNLGKLTMTLFYIPPLASLVGNTLVGGVQYYFSIGLASLSIGYLVARLIVDLVRWRKRWILRLISWHVVAEAIFMLSWVVMFAEILSQTIDNDSFFSSLSSQFQGHGYTFPGETSGESVDLAAGLMTLWVVSVIVETWLWWGQRRRSLSSVLGATKNAIPSWRR